MKPAPVVHAPTRAARPAGECCPIGRWCESCGTPDGGTMPTRLHGVELIDRAGPDVVLMCVTACTRCAGPLYAGHALPTTPATRGRLVERHTGHLAAALRLSAAPERPESPEPPATPESPR